MTLEKDVEQAREGLREQRLAGAGRADQEDVALRELDLVLGAAHVLEPLVVVVDGDRQDLLRLLLRDDVLVQRCGDLAGIRELLLLRARLGLGHYPQENKGRSSFRWNDGGRAHSVAGMAAPVRTDPDTGKTWRSAIKPLGAPVDIYTWLLDHTSP